MIVRITIDKGVQHEGPTHIELGTAQKSENTIVATPIRKLFSPL
jgi:hypothetical protein